MALVASPTSINFGSVDAPATRPVTDSYTVTADGAGFTLLTQQVTGQINSKEVVETVIKDGGTIITLPYFLAQDDSLTVEVSAYPQGSLAVVHQIGYIINDQSSGAAPDTFLDVSLSSVDSTPDDEVLSFPFRDGVVERLEWATNQSTKENGSEQTATTRGKARRIIQAQFSTQRHNNAYLMDFLYRNKTKEFYLPFWCENLDTGSVTTGTNLVNISLSGTHMKVGQLVGFYSSYDTLVHQSTVSVVNANDFQITDNFSASYDNLKVVPLDLGSLNSDPQRLSVVCRNNVTISFQHNGPDNIGEGSIPNLYKGVEVFLTPPNVTGELPVSFINPQQRLQAAYGKSRVFDKWLNTKESFSVEYIIEELQNIYDFKSFLQRRKGGARPFYMPTFENNLELSNRTGQLGSSFAIVDNQGSGLNNYINERNEIAVYFSDETWELREVVNYTDNGTTVTVNVDSAINRNKSEVVSIMYLPLMRLTSDSIQVRWIAKHIAIFSYAVREIST
jgi:hypothetical protein